MPFDGEVVVGGLGDEQSGRAQPPVSQHLDRAPFVVAVGAVAVRDAVARLVQLAVAFAGNHPQGRRPAHRPAGAVDVGVAVPGEVVAGRDRQVDRCNFLGVHVAAVPFAVDDEVVVAVLGLERGLEGQPSVLPHLDRAPLAGAVGAGAVGDAEPTAVVGRCQLAVTGAGRHGQPHAGGGACSRRCGGWCSR